jgi:hypothetical protein
MNRQISITRIQGKEYMVFVPKEKWYEAKEIIRKYEDDLPPTPANDAAQRAEIEALGGEYREYDSRPNPPRAGGRVTW